MLIESQDLEYQSKEHKSPYELDIKPRYLTRCRQCNFKLVYEKDAVLSDNEGTAWFCSNKCKTVWKPDNTSKICPLELANYGLVSNCLEQFLIAINLLYGPDTSLRVKQQLKTLDEECVTRAEVKNKAEEGDADSAFLIGLTYQLRYIDVNSRIAISPSIGSQKYNKSRVFSNSKALKYFEMAADDNHSESILAVSMLLYQEDNPLMFRDHLYRVIDSYPHAQQYNYAYLGFLHPKELTVNKHWADKRSILVLREGLAPLLYALNPTKCLNYGTTTTPTTMGWEDLFFFCVKQLKKYIDSKENFVILVMNHIDETIRLGFEPIAVENLIYKNTAGMHLPGTQEDMKAVLDISFEKKITQPQPLVRCVHSMMTNNCSECKLLARVRVDAVYNNTYWISIDEIHNGFHSVMFPMLTGNPDQLMYKMHEETFIQLPKCDIVFALKHLADNPADLHITQIAKNPIFYWPVIHHFGSVYRALLIAVGEKIKNAVFGRQPTSSMPPDIHSEISWLYPDQREDRHFIKCGFLLCKNLDVTFQFDVCTR